MNPRKIVMIIVILALVVATLVFALLPLLQPPPTPPEVDNPPELLISTPLEHSELSDVVIFNITVIDEEDLVADLFIDGTFRASSNNYTWDTTTETDGRHTIRASVEDSGGQKDSEDFEVTIDNIVEEFVFDDLFKIMTYNIKESGLNDDWKEIIKQENPDAIILVETGFLDDRSNEELNAATSELNAFFTDEMPYDSYTAQGVSYSTTGEAILSRFPVISFTQLDHVPMDDLSDYYVTHDFIDALLDINGTQVHVIGAHLKASEGESNQIRREYETEGIINYMDNLGNVPILYLGDQNSYSPDDTGDLAPMSDSFLGYGPMTMMLHPENETYGRYSSEVHNFTDVFRSLNPDDPGYTYGGQFGDPFMRIDYIIANSFFDGLFLNASVVDGELADSASDHYAVSAWINWTSVDENGLANQQIITDSGVDGINANYTCSCLISPWQQSLACAVVERK